MEYVAAWSAGLVIGFGLGFGLSCVIVGMHIRIHPGCEFKRFL